MPKTITEDINRWGNSWNQRVERKESTVMGRQHVRRNAIYADWKSGNKKDKKHVKAFKIKDF